MSQSTHLTPEHEIFRASARKFLKTECLPFRDAWQDDGKMAREVWRKAGREGFLCAKVSPAYGGGGGDLLHCAILLEEQTKLGFPELTFYLHSDIIAPYIELYGDEDQRRRYLPGMCNGDIVAAIAMTEPGAGSDLQAITTRAVRDGDHYRLTGQKTFISNAQNADLIIVAAKTDAAQAAKGISLFLVETQSAGFKLGRNLNKIGCKAQDSSELFFDDVAVPAANLLGGIEGRGFYQLMQRLPEERLIMAISSIASMEAAVEDTIAYVRDRIVFGQRLIEFQNTRFKLAEAKTTAVMGRTFLDRCIDLFIENDFDAVDGAMVKWWATERAFQVIDECLQLHGGYGYMRDSTIARLYADSRLGRIAGGTSEIMRDIIGRSL
ncbi:acyl-CoA dehydrogenase family protein [Terricaulis sp.]|uniref:acyl-CoA dehydrogenase family protein n=1 Tax=Terricaulis sp. TaxID=2768686 RepID=UPI002AC772CB|nr:acyl-CoA dehydrogenase family protein [Terricaulis sp.]MDZ4691709.1 acyl-CoA dehydrogenase family protein [Terricaulis sp.]